MSPASSSVSTYPGLARDAKPPLASSSSPMVCTRVPASYAGTGGELVGGIPGIAGVVEVGDLGEFADVAFDLVVAVSRDGEVAVGGGRNVAGAAAWGGVALAGRRGGDGDDRGGVVGGPSAGGIAAGRDRATGGERGVVVVEISGDSASALAVRAAARGRGCGPAAAGRRCGRGDGRGGVR